MRAVLLTMTFVSALVFAGCFGGGGCPAAEDTPLVLGTLLPVTGGLAAFGGSMEKAAVMAVEDLNAAGGAGGKDIRLVKGDTKTDPAQAPTAFLDLVNDGAMGVVGAASSGVTGSILDLAIDNEVFVMSPASTSPALTLDRDNEGWFARVPPSDALQGVVLADLVAGDGHQTATILAVNNDYGTGLGGVFKKTFEADGGEVLDTVLFEDGGTTFGSQVDLAGQTGADAIVLIAYPGEGTQIMSSAFEKGLFDSTTFYFSEGVKDEEGFVDVVGYDDDGVSIMAGLKGTTPESPDTGAFQSAYEARWGEEPTLFAAETYDAVVALALAAVHAGEHCGTAIKDNIRTIYNAPGTAVAAVNLAGALNAAAAGDVDYKGITNDFDLDANGDPTSGVYSYWQIADDGTIETIQSGIMV